MSDWISVVDWRTFQHYDPAKRQPPWIKTYVELMANEEYLSLSGHTRSILHGLWLEYASSRCRLHADTASLSSRLRLRVTKTHLQSLSDAGFIAIVASKTLADGYHDATPEVEVEKETPLPPTGSASAALRGTGKTESQNGAAPDNQASITDRLNLPAERIEIPPETLALMARLGAHRTEDPQPDDPTLELAPTPTDDNEPLPDEPTPEDLEQDADLGAVA